MIKKNETVTVGWCDNGATDGAFTEGLMSAIFFGLSNNKHINGSVRVKGNQIARQRQALLDLWYDRIQTDWLLCVDSDVVLTGDIWNKLYNTADSENMPMVSGIYFIAKETDGSLPVPMPVIFDNVDKHTVKYHHPLPIDSVIKIDCAGMGLVLIHKSVVTKLRKTYGNNHFMFAEENNSGEQFIGEDISFFRKCSGADIPLYAHTGAVAKHMKTTIWDLDLYNLYWNSKNKSSN
jgi:hypothetical protein